MLCGKLRRIQEFHKNRFRLLLEVYFPYEHVCSVVGRSFVQSVCHKNGGNFNFNAPIGAIFLLFSVSDPHFFADPDPGKNLYADPGGIRGIKGINDFFCVFFTFQVILNNFLKN